MSDDLAVQRASRLDTATLSDALDRCGLNGQCLRIKPRASSFRMTGRAWTLRYGPAAQPPGNVGDYIDEVPDGSVIVLDNGGREDATVWGDILTEIAHRRGLPGTLIDGVTVRAGDWVIADGSGVAFVPADRADEVISAAELIAAREAAMAKDLLAGRPVTEVMGSSYEHMLRPDAA